MRARRSTTLTLIAVATLALGACGAPGSGGGEAEPTSSGSSGLATCEPIAGDKLVVLEDDKGLQNADNIIPAVNKAAADAKPVPTNAVGAGVVDGGGATGGFSPVPNLMPRNTSPCARVIAVPFGTTCTVQDVVNVRGTKQTASLQA